MAVVIVIGVLSALVVKPLQGLMNRIKLQSAANGMKHALMNARLRAVANPDRQCGVVFRLHGSPTMDDSVFTFLERNPPDKLYVRGQDSLYLAPFVVKKVDQVVSSIPTGFPSVVVFRGDGSASASARVILSLKGLSDTLDVLASTGRVRVVSR